MCQEHTCDLAICNTYIARRHTAKDAIKVGHVRSCVGWSHALQVLQEGQQQRIDIFGCTGAAIRVSHGRNNHHNPVKTLGRALDRREVITSVDADEWINDGTMRV